MTIQTIIIRATGFSALTASMICFQQKKRTRILGFIFLAQIFWGIHFYLLGGYTVVLIDAVGMFRTFVFYKAESSKWAKHPAWLALFLILFMLCAVVAWEGWRSLLPVTAICIETCGFWLRKPKHIRFINIFPHPFWFSYNYIIGSYAGMVTELLVTTSVFTGIFRHDIRRKSKKKDPDLPSKKLADQSPD